MSVSQDVSYVELISAEAMGGVISLFYVLYRGLSGTEGSTSTTGHSRAQHVCLPGHCPATADSRGWLLQLFDPWFTLKH